MFEKKKLFDLAPKAMQNMIKMEDYIHNDTNIEPLMYELIKIRVSQINGCAFCLDMHTKDALKQGETPQRIFLLDAWRETRLFSEKEKLVLELAELVTLIHNSYVSPELYEDLSKYYSEKDVADLLIIINQINAWNRLNIATHQDIA